MLALNPATRVTQTITFPNIQFSHLWNEKISPSLLQDILRVNLLGKSTGSEEFSGRCYWLLRISVTSLINWGQFLNISIIGMLSIAFCCRNHALSLIECLVSNYYLPVTSNPQLWQQKCLQFSSDQSLSRVWLFVTPWAAAHQAFLSITNPQSLPKPTSVKSVMPFNHLMLCHPLLLPSIFPNMRVFSNQSALCIRWPKYWSFTFSISPSNEHPGLISFRIDWLDLLPAPGMLKSLLQHHSSKASILWCSTFFIVQFSHPYIWKNQSLD